MKNDEKQFESFISDIKFDDTQDIGHRDKLEQDIIAALKKQPRQKQKTSNIWRTIMNSRITRQTAVAAAIIMLAIVGWRFATSGTTQQRITSLTLLSRASAAEQTLFYDTGGIIHIANEIILYPDSAHDTGELLDELEADTTLDKNLAFIKSWLSYRWIPIYLLSANGHPYEHKLELAEPANEAVTISDLAWYDPATGCFARVLKTGDRILCANAYDGEFVYMTTKGPGGLLRIEQEVVSSEFQVPENPADFLGIAAGIKGTVPGKHYPPIQNVTTVTLEDGTPVRTYKLGFTDPWGKVETYFLFRFSTDTDIIDEIECIVEGKTTRVHRRVVAETVDNTELSWNLSELSADLTDKVSIKADAGKAAHAVTIRQMAERATSDVFIFSKEPSWTIERTIYDLPDETSTPARSFAATYRAKDGRDIVLCQGESFNRYFTAIFGKIQELGEKVSWAYESENGFKVVYQNDRNTELWWTEFALKSSGFEPRENRVGFILTSPANTFLVMAINGPVSKQEMQELVDSLIPTVEYVDSPD
jgi:hypothetical protein